MDIKQRINSILNDATIQIPMIDNAEPLISFEECEINYNDIVNNNKNIKNMLTTIPVCYELNELYTLINNVKIENVVNIWIIKSLNEVIENFEIMKEFTENNIIDFASTYIGMGWVYMIAYDPTSKSFFIRRDGGSNGFDRDENFKFICNYKAQEDNHVDFNYVLDIFSGKINLSDTNFKIIEH